MRTQMNRQPNGQCAHRHQVKSACLRNWAIAQTPFFFIFKQKKEGVGRSPCMLNSGRIWAAAHSRGQFGAKPSTYDNAPPIYQRAHKKDLTASLG